VRPPRGTHLLVTLLLLWLALLCGREFFLQGEGPPAFFLEKRLGVAVLLGEGFPRPGVHQFYDAVTPMGVMEMTGLVLGAEFEPDPGLARPLCDGEALDVVFLEGQVAEIKRFWMPAPQRLALGIPLHPDRMSREDWESLPGIGPRLAQAIEDERQRNGDFGSLEGVQRVKGIGEKRIAGWQNFFSERP